MSSQYPNEGSFTLPPPPPGNALQQFSDDFEDLSEINVNDLLEDDDFRINMGNQGSGSVQQPLMTNPSLEFGSNSFPVLNSLPGYHPMPIQTSPTAFGEISSCPNNFPPQNALPGQLLSEQPPENNHGYVGSCYFSDSFAAQNPLSGQHHPLPNQPSNENLESSFSVQNIPGHHPLPDQPLTATVESSFSVQNFPGHHPLPGQSFAANKRSSHTAQNSLSGQHPLPDQSSAPNVGNSYYPDSSSEQNSLTGQLPLLNQPSTANVESSFLAQNSFSGHNPRLDQTSAANVGNSYRPDSFSAQNSPSGQHPLPNQPLVANVGSSYCPDSFSAQNSLPRPLSLPNQLSSASAESSYSPDSVSAQNSLPRQLSLPNQLSTANSESSFSVQNSVPTGYHSLPSQSSTANVGNSHCPNIISVQNSLRGQLPRPNQPLTSNRFSGQNSLPRQLQINQPSNYANPGNSYYRQNSFAQLNSLPAQVELNLQSVVEYLRSFVPSGLLGKILPSIVQSHNAYERRNCSNRLSAVQNSLPGQNLPNQTSSANIRSSGANNFSAVQNLSNQTSTANIRSSGVTNFSAGQNLPNQTSTPNISSGPNNVSAVQNLSPGQGRGRGRGRGRARGRPPGNRNSRGRGRSISTGENNFQLLNFSPALNHPLSNRTTLMANIWSSNQNNVLSENILRIQQQQQQPPNSGANTGNSSDLNHHHAGNILQRSENPYNFPVAAGDPGPVSNQISSGNNIHPNNPLVGSNNFLVLGQDELPGENILRIQQQQQTPNSGENTGNSSNLNHHHHAGNILQSSENPYNFPVAVSSQVSSGNNIHPNNPLAGSNNFPVPGQDEFPGGQITGAGNNSIQFDNIQTLPQELVVVSPVADNNQTSRGTGNNIERTLDSVAANSSNNHAITEQPTVGDQNNNALQENSPVQIGEEGNHDNNNNNNNNSDVDHEGPELPPVEEINSAGKLGKSQEKDPPLAQGLSWLYSVKKPVKKRGDLDENCRDCYKRFCKSMENSFFRIKKYPGDTSDAEKYPTAGETNGSEKISGGLTSGVPDNGKAGETNGSEKNFGGLNSGAPDNGRVPIDQGTTDGSTISPLPPPPPPPVLVINSTVNAEAELVVNTVTTETAVLPSVSSSAVVDNNVNVASLAEMMEMETNYLTADAAPQPDQKWSEEFDMIIGM